LCTVIFAYCGIRKGNKKIKRYIIEDLGIIVETEKKVYEKYYGSLLIQAG